MKPSKRAVMVADKAIKMMLPVVHVPPGITINGKTMTISQAEIYIEGYIDGYRMEVRK